MNSPSTPHQFTLEPNDARRLASLCGQCDENLRQIEQRLGIEIHNRGNAFQLYGDAQQVHTAEKVLAQLYVDTKPYESLSAEHIHLFLQEANVAALLTTDTQEQPGIINTRFKRIKPKGKNQKGYVDAIQEHDVNFGIGPAGTGKTYLAVACAVQALEQQQVQRILLVRPAVEAGEKLGFLPGDLGQKIDPYLRPLYDALYEMLGFERVNKLMERQIIEVAPLAYMRGRTLNESFIILDESQNTTVEQMKMFLTRIGFGSTAVITGDITQIDLPKGARSGLIDAIEVLSEVKGISFTHFSSKDVVRHALVQRIVEAYAARDQHSGSAPTQHFVNTQKGPAKKPPEAPIDPPPHS